MAGKPAASASAIDRWAARLGRLSRGWRVLLSLVITLELVILLSFVVDRLLIQRVVEGDLARAAPAWIAVGVGLALYALGWWALVGFDWDPARPWRPGRAAVLYTAAGGAGLLVMIVLVLFGLAFGYLL
ncbi:MAG: hypothetical protein KBH93_01755 [Anaerolineae bacterium]|nr:hypothetical protein [Anaerolineae bacterium]